MRIVTGTGGFTVAWFNAMFENLKKSMLHMVCLMEIGNSQGEVEGQQFYQVHKLLSSLLVNQKCTLKSSGFLF